MFSAWVEGSNVPASVATVFSAFWAACRDVIDAAAEMNQRAPIFFFGAPSTEIILQNNGSLAFRAAPS